MWDAERRYYHTKVLENGWIYGRGGFNGSGKVCFYMNSLVSLFCAC